MSEQVEPISDERLAEEMPAWYRVGSAIMGRDFDALVARMRAAEERATEGWERVREHSGEIAHWQNIAAEVEHERDDALAEVERLRATVARVEALLNDWARDYPDLIVTAQLSGALAEREEGDRD